LSAVDGDAADSFRLLMISELTSFLIGNGYSFSSLTGVLMTFFSTTLFLSDL